jgi:hypothetical protein
MKFEKTYTKEEVKRNKEDKETTIFSNDMRDACKVKCKICDKEVVMSSKSNHTRRVHCLSLAEYKDIYGDHKMTLVRKMCHKCGVCEEVLLLDAIEVAIHLRRKKHNISQKKYIKCFITYKASVKIERDFERKPKEENVVLYKGKYRKEEFKSLTTKQILEELDLVLGA